nr:MAG TPA: hypothetical protein [Caudoviricetes sp.]
MLSPTLTFASLFHSHIHAIIHPYSPFHLTTSQIILTLYLRTKQYYNQPRIHSNTYTL